MAFRVVLNNADLVTNPAGLNDLTFTLNRDNNIFGIYVIGTADLTFLGDGFCILRDAAEAATNCNVPIEIKFSCNGGAMRTIFTGIISIGTIKLDYKKGEAKAEIEDNSPLALISTNSEIPFDFDSTKDIFNEEKFTPSYDLIDMFDELGDYVVDYEDVPMISLETAVEKIVTFMTGKECRFESDFFTNEGTYLHYKVVFSGAPVGTQVTTVKYTNFYGENREFIIPFILTPTAHLGQIALALSENNFGNPVTAAVVRSNLNQFFQRGMNAAFVDAGAFTIDVYTNVPFKNVSVTTTSSGGPTVAVTLEEELVDSAFNPYFLNYSMLKKIDTSIRPYKFSMTFKELMTELNKLTNCFFTAIIDPANSNRILIRIEDENYFLSQSPTLILNDVRDLKADFLEANIYSQLQVGSKQSQDSTINNNDTLTSLFCGVNNTFNADSDFVLDPVQIFVDLATAIDPDSTKTDKYIIQVNNTDDQAKKFELTAGAPTFWTYNLQLNNNTTILRHLSKFKGNLSGSPNKNIDNISNYKLFTKFQFNRVMNMSEFNSYVSFIDERIRFKTDEMTSYFTGIVQRIDYKFLSGEATFTVVGSTDDF